MASTLTREQHLDLYYFLRLNRELEEQMVRLFRQNKILGGLYSSYGQEAISVGTAFALGPGDWIAPMIRNIGALLVRGVKPREVLTQHMARYNSPTQGKDGTSHFADLKVRHIVAPSSVLGDLIPVMTGVAMAGRYLGQKIVAMTWIGDGGTSTGTFHEGLNLAAVQKAPLVLVIENNGWAYATPVERQTPLRDLADRAKAYGIESAVVDGNDVLAVERTARKAVAHARAGNGPVLIEAKTMRMRGHAQHDGAEYVPKEILEAWKKRDPIDRYEKFLTNKKLWDVKTKKEIDVRIAREIQTDVEFAESSPLPPPETAEYGVYCEGCHTIAADWKRPRGKVMPPRSSVKSGWTNGISRSAKRSVGFGKSDARSKKEVSPDRGSRKGGTLVAETTYLEAIRQALSEEMDRDPAVVMLGEDIGVYGGAFKATEGLLERFGWERVIDTPISESAIVGAAVGMGYAGLRPVAEMQFIDFIACCFEIVTNYAAKSHYLWGAPVPMVLRGPCGGGVHGGPFHSANPEMHFVHTPGLKVVCPATPYDAKGLLKSAIRDNNPVLFFEHKFLYRRVKEDLPEDEYTVPIGKAAVRREGRDLTIVTYAAMVHTSLEAAKELEREGIDAEVVDLRTLLPLDRDTVLASVRKTNKLLIVHEDTRTGGIAGEIAAIVTESAFDDLDGPIRRVTSLDTPVPYAPTLEDYFMPDTAKVVAAARELAHY